MAQYSVSRNQYFNSSNKDLHEVFMLSDKDGNIINSFGSASNIPISSGDVEGYKHINKFGATADDVTNGTIWDGNVSQSFIPYPSPGVIVVVAGNSNDTGKEVYVEGLDTDWNEQSEVIAAGSLGTKTFKRVFRAYMVDGSNDGDITLRQSSTACGYIKAGNAQTLMAVYTVPAGKTAYLMKLQLGSDKASTNSAMTYSLDTKEDIDGGVFRIKGRWFSAGGQNIVVDYPVPLRIPEKTDIRIDVKAAQATACSATFDLILVDNA